MPHFNEGEILSESGGSATAPIMAMRGVSKTFPGVRALDKVSFQAHPGEVHMLLGQNGAGKSTLIKILYGAYHPDEGEFLFEGRQVRIGSPADARRLGIAVIFQEFSLVPYLDIAQNIFLGHEFRGRLPGQIDHSRMHAEARKLLDTLGMDLDTRTLVHRLGVAQQQMIEIAKALSQDARILVMDEPTASLSGREIERLFAVIRRLRGEGVAIIYISHRLAEVFELGDRITVLRDGRNVAAMLPSQTGIDELVRLMIGREVDTSYGRKLERVPGEVALEVKGLCSRRGIADVNLVVRTGEIVGLSGLVGSGRTEVVRAIFGADPVTAGEVVIFGKAHQGGPVRSVREGMALVPENRKQEGLGLIRSVQDNLLLAGLRKLFPSHWFKPGLAGRTALDLIAKLGIATPSPQRLVKYLSGGNQQKVVIGKWLAAGSRFFIFDEPTRGIDVGAKAEIFGLIEQLVAQGAAVLMVSSELIEIVKVCDRAYVMRDGGVVGELQRETLTEENILRLAMHHE